MSEHAATLVLGGILGLLQGIILFVLTQGVAKIKNICDRIDKLQAQLGLKGDASDMKKIEVTLGKYGNRLLKLEFHMRIKESNEEEF